MDNDIKMTRKQAADWIGHETSPNMIIQAEHDGKNPMRYINKACEIAEEILRIDFHALISELESEKVNKGDGYFYKKGIDDAIAIIKKYINTEV